MAQVVLRAGPEQAGAQEYAQAIKVASETRATFDCAAKLCVFLASPASDGITGRLISAVWDPWESLPEHAAELNDSDIYTLRRIVPDDRGKRWGERK
jgi:3-oxoacyl-[acyl-carrier protein] reductase